MKLYEALATGKKIKRAAWATIFLNPKTMSFNLEGIEADDWEVEDDEFKIKMHDYYFNPSSSVYVPAYYTRSTKELAEESRKNMIRMLRLDALMRQLEPDWVANWNDDNQVKCRISFKKSNGFSYERYIFNNFVGAPTCSKQTAIKICELLNSGKFSLEDE